MRRSTKLAIIIIHTLLLVGLLIAEVTEEDTLETSTEAFLSDEIGDSSTNATTTGTTETDSATTELPSSTSASAETEIEAVDHKNVTSSTSPAGPPEDDGLLWRLLRMAGASLMAVPMYFSATILAYAMSLDSCPGGADRFWLQQYCMYGHYFVFILVILFAPVVIVLGPLVLFIIQVVNGPFPYF